MYIMNGMVSTQFSTIKGVNGMSIVKSADALEILSQAYGKHGGNETKPKRWDLRQEQLELLRGLSERYSESQISILRGIIDEWREMKLKECEAR